MICKRRLDIFFEKENQPQNCNFTITDVGSLYLLKSNKGEFDMQIDTFEKAAGLGAIGLWAALHGWLGWLAVLYAISVLIDCITGTALAIKEKSWDSSMARQGLWRKGASFIMICVGILTDVLLGLTIDHIPAIQLPFEYDMLLTPTILFGYILSELGSIFENAAKMGAPIPTLIKSVLGKLQDSSLLSVNKKDDE